MACIHQKSAEVKRWQYNRRCHGHAADPDHDEQYMECPRENNVVHDASALRLVKSIDIFIPVILCCNAPCSCGHEQGRLKRSHDAFASSFILVKPVRPDQSSRHGTFGTGSN
jgi:hypothetical protein